ncbi:MAG: hypothetical protein WBV82_18640 [Myxococcaceae bacterium]
MRNRIALRLVWASAVLLGIEAGGGLFEHLVLDRAWPSNLALIQPNLGGVNRGTFWIAVHTSLTVILLGALWATWPQRPLRIRVAWALGIHVALRVWSFAYFIPAAIRFEAAQAVVDADVRAWVIQSPLRTLVTLIAWVILFRPRDIGSSLPGSSPDLSSERRPGQPGLPRTTFTG